jgi:hypothetical protein
MGLDLGSFITSIFTPQGYNASVQQNQNDQNVGNYSGELAQGEYNYQNELQGIRQQELPNMLNAVNQLWNFTTQSGRNALQQQAGQINQANAAGVAANAPSMFAGNPSLGAAYGLSAQNEANQATAQYGQSLNSAQAEGQADQTALQAEQALNPNYSGMSQLSSNVYGEPKVPVNNTLGQILSVLPQVFSGSGLFGGTSGNTATSTATPAISSVTQSTPVSQSEYGINELNDGNVGQQQSSTATPGTLQWLQQIFGGGNSNTTQGVAA